MRIKAFSATFILLVLLALTGCCGKEVGHTGNMETTNGRSSSLQEEIPASVPENPYDDVGHVLKYVDSALYANPAEQWFQDDSLQEAARRLSAQLKPEGFTTAESYAEALADHLDPYLKEKSYMIEGVSCINKWELRRLEQFEGGWCAWYWEVIDTSSGFEGKSELELFDIRYSLHDSAAVVLFSDDGHIITILDGMEYKPLSPKR